MTRYLPPSEPTPEVAVLSTRGSVFRHKRVIGAAWSLVTVTFAVGVGWLIVRSLMI